MPRNSQLRDEPMFRKCRRDLCGHTRLDHRYGACRVCDCREFVEHALPRDDEDEELFDDDAEE